MKYVIDRLIQLIPVLLGITFLSFAMMQIAGSDAITEMYADKGAVSVEIINAKRAELGLDKPFIEQYFIWLGGLVRGDMGVSYVSGKDVFDTFISKLPATILLTISCALPQNEHLTFWLFLFAISKHLRHFLLSF